MQSCLSLIASPSFLDAARLSTTVSPLVMVSACSDESALERVLGALLEQPTINPTDAAIPFFGPASLKPELIVPLTLHPLLHLLMLESCLPLSPLSTLLKSRNRVPFLSHGFDSTLLTQLPNDSTSPTTHSGRGALKTCSAPLSLFPLLLLLFLPLLTQPLTISERESSAALPIASLSRKIAASTLGSIIFRQWLAETMLMMHSTFCKCQVLPKKWPSWRNKRSLSAAAQASRLRMAFLSSAFLLMLVMPRQFVLSLSIGADSLQQLTCSE